MLEIRRTPLDQQALRAIAPMIASVFPQLPGLDDRYLAWWYRDNPQGQAIAFSAFDGDKPVAHFGAPIMRGFVEGREETGVLFQNVATIPGYRRQRLFPRLMEAVLEAAAHEGHTFAYAASNASSTPTATKHFGFQLLCQLDVRVGAGLPHRIGPEIESEFAISLSPAALEWRLRPPHRRYTTARSRDRSYVLGPSGVRGVPAVLASFDEPCDGLDRAGRVATSVWVGLDPGRRWPFYWPRVPLRLRPAPLNLIFRDLRSGRRLDPARVRIDAIHIDQF